MRDEADQLQFPALALMTAEELKEQIKNADYASRWLDESIKAANEAGTYLGGLKERVKKSETIARDYLQRLSEEPAVKPYVNGVTTIIDLPKVAAAPALELVKATKKTGNKAMILWKVWGAKKGLSLDELVAQVLLELPDNVPNSINQQVLAMAKTGLISRDQYGQQLFGYPPGKPAPPKPKKLIAK
jgi:hypothetical protein